MRWRVLSLVAVAAGALLLTRLPADAAVACGAALGLVYYRLAGCEGSCPITSDPWLTAAWLGIIGLLLSAATAKNSEKDKD